MNRRSFAFGFLSLWGCTTMGDNESRVIAGPVDEGAWLNVNGQNQWLALRGKSAANPVLLFLHGGPGIGVASMMPLSEDGQCGYTSAVGDQPGSAATGAARRRVWGCPEDVYSRPG